MRRGPALPPATAVATLTLRAGRSAGAAAGAAARPRRSSRRPPVTPVNAAPTAAPADALPPVRDAVSLPALMREKLRGGTVRRERRQLTTDAYARYEVTYPSGDLRVSGVLLVPTGK